MRAAAFELSTTPLFHTNRGMSEKNRHCVHAQCWIVFLHYIFRYSLRCRPLYNQDTAALARGPHVDLQKQVGLPLVHSPKFSNRLQFVNISRDNSYRIKYRLEGFSCQRFSSPVPGDDQEEKKNRKHIKIAKHSGGISKLSVHCSSFLSPWGTTAFIHEQKILQQRS